MRAGTQGNTGQHTLARAHIHLVSCVHLFRDLTVAPVRVGVWVWASGDSISESMTRLRGVDQLWKKRSGPGVRSWMLTTLGGFFSQYDRGVCGHAAALVGQVVELEPARPTWPAG
jgi:hypothetical protein